MCSLASVGVCLHHWLSYGKIVDRRPAAIPLGPLSIACTDACESIVKDSMVQMRSVLS